MQKVLFPVNKVFSITLVMPLFIQVFKILGVGIHLNVVLLFLLSLYLFGSVLVNYRNLGIGKISAAFFIFFILSLLQIISLSRILPILFFFQCFLLTLFIPHDKFGSVIRDNRKLIYFVTVVYVSVSLLLLALKVNFNPTDGRFYGLAYSPTTFVLYLVVLLALFHYVYKSNLEFHILFCTSIVLTFFSGTRTGLLLLLLLPVNNYIYDRYLRSKTMVRVILFVFILTIYPLIEYISLSNPEWVEFRFSGDESEVDYSYASRMAYTAAVADEWVNGSQSSKLVGFGTEFSRMKIIDLFDEDIQLHNDFLRVIVDFGLPAALVFLSIIYSLSRNNKYSYFLALVYLFSFYHNMIYEVFLFNTLLFMYKTRYKKEVLVWK